jgi:hypothetical protein
VRPLLTALVAALAVAAALAPAGAATNECRGITACIRVPGPWVLVPAHGTTEYLLSCPGGRSVVAGLDAQASSRSVRVSFDGRIGAPVQPGVTTTRYALFRAVSTSGRPQTFQPLLGCVPVQGGGGRSTVSARTAATPAGPSLELRSRIVIIGPGQVRFAKVACKAGEQLVGSWQAVAFRVKKPPSVGSGTLVHVTRVRVGKQVVATATATDGLSIDVHAIVQVGAECAP